ncbi:MAG: hypothetical protein FWE23_01135 [Chitinivibrionia bacterium]|jgi:hypothetical protein|nr:hypothetical protein [Chitinivibrionia bacterium]
MDFFRGIAGLFLYIGALFVPVDESRLDVRALNSDSDAHYHIRTTFEFQWSDNLTDIVNAGIPITMKYSARVDRQRQDFYRILRRPVSQRYYFVIDSVPGGDTNSRSFPNIPVALRHFRQIEWEIDNSAKNLDFSVEILNSFVPSMEIYVDISPAFGGRRFSERIRIENAENTGRRSR